jgi:hypothetical protein
MRQFHKPRRGRLSKSALIIEAYLYLLLARLVLEGFGFLRLTGLFSSPLRKPELAGRPRRRARKEVQGAIFYVWRRFPWKPNCFHRALAAQAMLRRRGVSTTLYYGATTLPERGLTGHVWVQDGPIGVVGHIAAKGFRVLARFPEPSSSTGCAVNFRL